jgi:triacylglycerol esterase/lipase EstA (alpha/beta hydrolase family)
VPTLNLDREPEIISLQAFNIAVFEERYKPICAEVKAIIFFATPHRGSDYADFFSQLGHVINFSLMGTSRFSGKTNVELIKSLSKQSPQLSEISQQFRHRTKYLKIFSLIEDWVIPPLKDKVCKPATFLFSVLQFK